MAGMTLQRNASAPAAALPGWRSVAGHPAPARPATARSAITGPATARPRTAAPVAGPTPRPAPGQVRLTRRGRVVLVLLLAAVALLAFSIGRASSHAGGDAPRGPRPVVVVQPGESLWQIALRAVPRADPRETVARIVELNGLSGGAVQPGQRLVLPD